MRKPKDRPTGPVRDPLEVGLDRHKPAGAFLPEWVVERGGWIGILVVVVLFGVPFKILTALRSGSGAGEPVVKTHLAVVHGPAKVWREGTTSHLERVTVRIKNSGPGVAQGVWVGVRVRSVEVPLSGAAELAVGAEATYTAVVNLSATEAERVDAVVRCTNCGG